MKIRNGFVSNSSSSSFVVACEKGKKKTLKVKLEVDLDDFMDKRITNVTELAIYLAKERYWDFDSLSDSEKATHEQYVKVLESGRELMFGSFSNEDDSAVSRILCDEGLKMTSIDKDDVIDGWDGGY